MLPMVFAHRFQALPGNVLPRSSASSPVTGGETRSLDVEQEEQEAELMNWAHFNWFTDLHPLVNPKCFQDLIAMDRELRSGKGK
jgi:hypothetical protein